MERSLLPQEWCAKLAVGDQVNGAMCPLCEGGESGERSFSVTRTAHGAEYICHRASCGFSGRVVSGETGTSDADFSDVAGAVRKVGDRTLRPYKGRMFDGLPAHVRALLADKWSMTDVLWHDWRWAPDFDNGDGRIMMPCRDRDGAVWGYVARTLFGHTPKTINYRISETGTIHYEMVDKWRGPTVLVEDIPSAKRLSEYVNSVALLGSALSHESAVDLRKVTASVVVALDADATDKAHKIVKTYGMLFQECYVLPLTKDFKNMTHSELDSFLFKRGIYEDDIPF